MSDYSVKKTDISKTAVFLLCLMITACSSLRTPKPCTNCIPTNSNQSSKLDTQKDGYYRCSRAANHRGRVIGDGHCVALIRSCSDAPLTSQWRAGQQVIKTDVTPGTIIATFKHGRYPNQSGWHAAIFIEQDDNGIWVWDQWVGKPVHRRLIRYRRPAEHVASSNTAQDYRIIVAP